MTRKRLFSGVAALVFTAACSNTPGSPSSPSGVSPTTAALNPDGSNLKVTAPSGLSPNGGVTGDRRPTLAFNGSSGRFQPLSGAVYELEVLNAQNTTAYTRNISGTSHTLESDLTYADNYTWRVRARVGTAAGPWSTLAGFRTPDPPAPPPPPVNTGGGTLPFPVPAACGPGEGDKYPCVAAVAALSVEWARCAGGSGVGCHRFTRQVVYALSRSDPNWQMIQAAPGGYACNCSSCGPSDGTMFREDTTVYAGRNVYDMIVGASGPNPSLNWSFVGPPRNVDAPGNAPVCP